MKLSTNESEVMWSSTNESTPHLLLRHPAEPVVEVPHDGAEEDVGAAGEVAAPGLHVLPGLEPAPHPGEREIYPGFALIGPAPTLLRSHWSKDS